MKLVEKPGEKRSWQLLHQAEIVDPELTSYRTTVREPPDTQYQKLAIRPGRKFAGCGFPETRFLQLIAVV
jgi:hypothetical protein